MTEPTEVAEVTEPTEPTEPTDAWLSANHRYLVAALEILRCRLADDPAPLRKAQAARNRARRAMTEPPALDRIADGFGLSPFERDVLLMAAGPTLDTPFAHVCAQAQGDSSRTYATFALALAKLPGAHWTALSPAGPLRRTPLLRLAHPDIPTTSALYVEERILHALAGVSYLDPELEPYVAPPAEPEALSPALAEAARAVAAIRSAEGGPGAAPVLVHGRQRAGLRHTAAAAYRSAGLRPVCLRAADLPADPAARDRLARLCERESVLTGIGWIIDVDDAVPECGRTAMDLAGRLAAPVVVTAREPLDGPGPRRPVRVAVGRASADELRTVWRQALGPAAAGLDRWIDMAAGQFDLDADDVAAVAAVAGQDPPPADGTATDPDDTGARLWDACRRQARPALNGLAERIEPRADWQDLVLPATQVRVLRQIAAHVRHRLTVWEDWGFAARSGRGLGTAALFSGPSGTGKTLAAEVIAGALRLDLYRIDLSQVVDKYIGETEKNLSRVFDAAEAGGAVLLFDEADALFGKRSEVKDSHDRHANIEVGYLLQRIEAYRGLAVLTTNLKDSLDPAFLRRLRFTVPFPFPDASAREEIWRRVFPEQTPAEGLDPAALARLSVSGGTIRNIALGAAFLAADAGRPVAMDHLLAAARTEYAKLERPLTGAEVAGWTAR
ncbi:ATP-binding protein [Streptomyces hyaluromycini]|uniref:ATP-binding protein n=1 Tax=Streptomyces hyaluromycini TaxID=1377993 RepID=UPI000B5C4C69|nr:ATP-binding protein [Streptomyces hyaluromycini]